MICTLVLARSRHPGGKHSLDALCSRFGVDRSQRIKHGALLDAQLLAQVYVELTGGRQIGLSLLAESAKLESAGVVVIEPRSERPMRPARTHSASLEELEAHANFLSKIKEPLWASVSAG
jgi:DNA polymerase-3 subunit epsilon